MRSNKKNILITGVSGLLGNNLAYYFRENSSVLGVYHTNPVSIDGIEVLGLDLTDYVSTRKMVSGFKPDVVIHCASRTDVDRMEHDREGAWQANVLTTRVILDALRDASVKFIHISTDSVYSGEKGPYKEESETKPCNFYGKTKLESEKLVMDYPNALILRTNIFGWNIQNKLSLGEWFLDRLRHNKSMHGFSDVFFSPIYTFLLAEILEKCIEKDLAGIYNCGGGNLLSKYDFGCKIADLFGYDPVLIRPMPLSDSGLTASRGKDLGMDVSKIENALEKQIPQVNESVKAFQEDYERGLPEEIKKYYVVNPPTVYYPVRKDIPYGRQAIDENDINAVVKVLKSYNLTQGSEAARFEQNIRRLVGSKHAVAVNSGTSALHLACLAAGVGHGDEVITSPITFVASANCAVYCGAAPVFCDIDERTYNISPYELEKKITDKTRAVIPVHFAGQSCDMAVINEIIHKKEQCFGKKIFIIEDACHALGSEYRNKKVGCCEYSDMSVFSFHPVKHITTGEGGMVVTNDEQLGDKIRMLRSHGITRKALSAKRQAPSVEPWYYEQQLLGFNYRITDIQCALGLSQLEKLDMFRKRRREIVNIYNKAFSSLKNIHPPFESTECDSNFHLYVLLFDFEKIGIDRARFMLELKKKGIQTQVHYIPVHLQTFYQKNFGTKWGDCPNAEHYYQKCLSIPLYPAMADEDVVRVIREITHHVRRK